MAKRSFSSGIEKECADETSDTTACFDLQVNDELDCQTSLTEPDAEIPEGHKLLRETQKCSTENQPTQKRKRKRFWKYGQFKKSQRKSKIPPRRKCLQLCKTKTSIRKAIKMSTLAKLGRQTRNVANTAKIDRFSAKCADNTEGEPFVQNVNCLNKQMKFPKCRECLKDSSKRNAAAVTDSFCRFVGYRKLSATKNGNFIAAGFLKPSDATHNDKLLWLVNHVEPPKDLTIETSKELLIQVGDQFCDLVKQEKAALLTHNISSDENVTWKKQAPGVREMCDVCDTTLFNVHWVCPACGFAVCIDCYQVRIQCPVIEHDVSHEGDRDGYGWLLCNNRKPHFQNQLLITEMIPGDALWILNDAAHEVRARYGIDECKCTRSNTETSRKPQEAICKPLMNCVSKSFSSILTPPSADGLSFLRPNTSDFCTRPRKWPSGTNTEDLPFEEEVKEVTNSDFETGEVTNSVCYNSLDYIEDCMKRLSCKDNSLEKYQSISDMVESISAIEEGPLQAKKKNLSDYVNDRYPQPSDSQELLPLHIFTLTESSLLYEDVPHSWICNGRLLVLHSPDHGNNLKIFQEQWKRGQPVMVMGVNNKLNESLWHPDSFCVEFGHIKSDLVDCQTGTIISNLPMSTFWRGFENFDQRMKGDTGEHMLLKLKDWPPGEDFSEKLPERFKDLMRSLPLPEYTHRDGIFNLAGRLPSWLVKPDLGPKMYNAYGSALYPTKGTTNLHLDMSDAVNVMVYVGIPKCDEGKNHVAQALNVFDDGDCDSLTRYRIRSRGTKAGALWHIYDSRNVDKIRAFLTKVAIERGEKLEAHHDPIHDQSWYLDTELRRRLDMEYGVRGYAIAQCLGDAIFIPAGAPHQVKNLHSCVKIAEDFVSPENIAHCFELTEEFRHLSDTHTNHEDKLQIKNIVYHVVKDALSHLI